MCVSYQHFRTHINKIFALQITVVFNSTSYWNFGSIYCLNQSGAWKRTCLLSSLPLFPFWTDQFSCVVQSIFATCCTVVYITVVMWMHLNIRLYILCMCCYIMSPFFFTFFRTWDLGFVIASSNSVKLTTNKRSRAELTIQCDCSFVYLSVLLLLLTNWHGKNHTIWKFYFYFVLFLK